MTADRDISGERWRTILGGFTLEEFAFFFGLPIETVKRAASALESRGALQPGPDGRWRFVPPVAAAEAAPSPSYVVDGLLSFLSFALSSS